MHTALRLGVAVAQRVRQVNPAAHICFYGLYATLNADHLLNGPGDSVISGEFEAPLVALAEALDRDAAPESVPGVGTANRPAAPVLEALPPAMRALPPDRDGLPELRSYAGLERAGTIVRAGAIEATRGCHHMCRHCPIPPIYGGKFHVVPREAVLADARAQIAAGARHLTFTDPDFFNGPGHGLRIMRALRADYPWLTFDVTIKVEHLLQHHARLPELAELGCVFVVSAVESLSDRVLERLDKGHTRADVDAAIDLLDAVGVPMRPSLLPFTPWETLAGYRDLLAWVAARDLIGCVDPIMLAIRLLIPPGSNLLTDAAGEPWLGELDAANFTYRWTHPDPRMDALHRAVSIVVERAAAANAPDAETFAAIWAAAAEAAGVAPPPIPTPAVRRPPAPGLTESWFC
ncbi:MAG: radical SAM protein, partial [Thermomicrobiales bacterium]|nr:radical SAM protein [Thermomicrobiales bacterium]